MVISGWFAWVLLVWGGLWALFLAVGLVSLWFRSRSASAPASPSIVLSNPAWTDRVKDLSL